MAKGFSFPRPLSDIATGVLDPLLRKRAGMSVAMIQSWDEIAGPGLSEATRPEKIAWPRRISDDDPYQPATLIVAAEGFAALKLQHETGELIARVNSFFGYPAIGRVKIVQKPVRPETNQRKPPRKLDPAEEASVSKSVGAIEDDGLRASLERLGRSVLAARKPR